MERSSTGIGAERIYGYRKRSLEETSHFYPRDEKLRGEEERSCSGDGEVKKEVVPMLRCKGRQRMGEKSSPA
jgi:hypothetical protein